MNLPGSAMQYTGLELTGYQECLLKHWHLSTGMIDIEIMTVAVKYRYGWRSYTQILAIAWLKCVVQ